MFSEEITRLLARDRALKRVFREEIFTEEFTGRSNEVDIIGDPGDDSNVRGYEEPFLVFPKQTKGPLCSFTDDSIDSSRDNYQ